MLKRVIVERKASKVRPPSSGPNRHDADEQIGAGEEQNVQLDPGLVIGSTLVQNDGDYECVKQRRGDVDKQDLVWLVVDDGVAERC